MKNQETLEEVANEYSKKKYSIDYGYCEEDYYISFLSFRDGAKWQAERRYSEEEVLELLNKREDYINSEDNIFEYQSAKKWLEQFKKK